MSVTELIGRARLGDADAFVALMEGQKQSFYRVARSYLRRDADIADAMQEAVLICWEKLPALRKPQYFKTWATRILINICNNMLRERQRCDTVDEFPEVAAADPGRANAEFVELLDSLDEKYRTVLLLYYGEGFHTREIAQLLSMKEETVKTRLKRGREQAKTAYEKE